MARKRGSRKVSRVRARKVKKVCGLLETGEVQLLLARLKRRMKRERKIKRGREFSKKVTLHNNGGYA